MYLTPDRCYIHYEVTYGRICLISAANSSSSEDKNKILQKMKDAATRFRRDIVTERDLLAVVTDQLDG